MSRKGGNSKGNRKSSGRVKTEEEEEDWHEAESEDVSASANVTQESAANATAGGDGDGDEGAAETSRADQSNLLSPPVRDSTSRLSSERSGEFETENLARSTESVPPHTPLASELSGSTDNLLKIRIPFSKLKANNPLRVNVRYSMPQGERLGQLRLDLPDALASGGSPLLARILSSLGRGTGNNTTSGGSNNDLASIARRDVDPLREELYHTRKVLQAHIEELCTELELLHQWKLQDPNAQYTRPVAPSLEPEPIQTPKARRNRDGLDYDESPYSPRPKSSSTIPSTGSSSGVMGSSTPGGIQQAKAGGSAGVGSKLAGKDNKKRSKPNRISDSLMDSELEDEIDVLESEASAGSPRPSKPKPKLFGAAAASAAAAAAAHGTPLPSPAGAGRPPKLPPKEDTPRSGLPKRIRKKTGIDDDDDAAALLEDDESANSAAASTNSAAAAAAAAADEVLYTHPLDPHSFWTLLMPWLRDLTDADIQLMQQKILRPDDPLLTIPPLGRPHAEHPTAALVKGARGSAAFGSDEDHMDVNGDQPVYIGEFTSRLLQALVEEKLVDGASGSTSTASAAAGGPAHDFEFGEEVALPLHSAPQWDYSYTGMLAIEERIKSDLKSLGIFDETERDTQTASKDSLSANTSAATSASSAADQNDEICAELRSLHVKLREKNTALNAIRAKILPHVEPKVNEYRQARKEREPLEADEQIYIRDFKKKPKSRKQKGSKKEKDK